MATEIPTGDDHIEQDKPKPAKPPKPPKPKSDKHGPSGKAGKGKKAKAGKHAGHATPDLADRLRTAAEAVAGAATRPRGIAIGAVAATVGLIAGFVAVAGRRSRAAAAAPLDERRDRTGEPAETIGAIMAKAAERDGTA